MAKVQISIDDKLLERADSYAENNYMSRSGLISLSLSQFLNAQEATTLIRDMSAFMQKIADKDSIDDETMKQLEEFEQLANLIK